MVAFAEVGSSFFFAGENVTLLQPIFSGFSVVETFKRVTNVTLGEKKI
jgi:hypothetical protein